MVCDTSIPLDGPNTQTYQWPGFKQPGWRRVQVAGNAWEGFGTDRIVRTRIDTLTFDRPFSKKGRRYDLAMPLASCDGLEENDLSLRCVLCLKPHSEFY